MIERPTPSAGTFAWLAAGVLAFTIYGSLVPFHFVPHDPNDAWSMFQSRFETSRALSSKSDFVANVLLGVPLGFCLLAACSLDMAWPFAKKVLAALVLWPWCIVFAVVVEFSQLYFRERTSSPSDVLAQASGSLVGLLAWLVFGERFVTRFRRVWQGDRIGGTPGRLLAVYIGMLALVLWLPLDLTLSPAELWHKNLDEPTKLVLMPFSETGKLPTWLATVGVFLPAGLLGGGINNRRWNSFRVIPSIVLRAMLLASILEAGQFFVKSRTASITDLLLGAFGFTLGWMLTRIIRPVQGRGLSLDLALMLLQAWIIYLLVINWMPFDFQLGLSSSKITDIEWVPFAAAYEKNYLSSLEEAGSKTLLFSPLGAVLGAVGVRRVSRRRTAIVFGMATAALVEAGQLWLPSRIVGPTDLVFGGLGAWLGSAAALRLRAFGYGSYQPPPPPSVRFRVT